MTGASLTDILQIAQTVSVIAGIIAFYFEYKKTSRERGYQTYIDTIASLVDLEKLFIEHPEMQRIWEYNREYMELNGTERKVYHYCSMLQDIFEIVFIASPLNRDWMSKDEWEGWEELIRDLARNIKEFKLSWKLNRDMYAEAYRSYMDKIIGIAAQDERCEC